VIAKRNAPAAQVTRAKIALLANEHVRLRDIADELDISHFMVSKWVRRFVLYGVRSLGDAPRSGVPRTHGDDKIAEIIKLRNHDHSTGCLNPPANQYDGSPSRCVRSHGGEHLANLWSEAPHGRELHSIQ
jgi:transposase